MQDHAACCMCVKHNEHVCCVRLRMDCSLGMLTHHVLLQLLVCITGRQLDTCINSSFFDPTGLCAAVLASRGRGALCNSGALCLEWQQLANLAQCSFTSSLFMHSKGR